jgi:hypothetical protein
MPQDFQSLVSWIAAPFIVQAVNNTAKSLGRNISLSEGLSDAKK